MIAWKQIPIILVMLAVAACTPPPATDTPADAAGDKAQTTGASGGAAATKAPAKPPVVVPADTELQIVLNESLNSGKNKSGDEFTGSLNAPITVDGATVLDKGTKVHGKVVSAEGSGRVKGLASIGLQLTGVMVDDKMIPITTKTFGLEAENTKKRDAGIIGGAAGVGAVVGAIAGGGKGAVTGAVIGGGAGTGTVLATKGKEVNLPSETKLRFTLGEPVTLNR